MNILGIVHLGRVRRAQVVNDMGDPAGSASAGAARVRRWARDRKLRCTSWLPKNPVRMERSMPGPAELLNPDHATKAATIDRALRRLGKRADANWVRSSERITFGHWCGQPMRDRNRWTLERRSEAVRVEVPRLCLKPR